MNEIIFTHCGKLGDFLYSLPLASALHKQTGKRIHFVLVNGFRPFHYIENLLRLQPFTANVTLVDHKVFMHGHGGQPYKFNPADYGVTAEKFYNIGFRGYPDKFITAFYAEEYGLGWDTDFTLELGEVEPNGKILRHEAPEIATASPGSEPYPMPIDLLELGRLLKGAKECHLWYSGPAALLFFARVPFFLHYEAAHPPRSLYLPENQFGGAGITPVLYSRR